MTFSAHHPGFPAFRLKRYGHEIALEVAEADNPIRIDETIKAITALGLRDVSLSTLDAIRERVLRRLPREASYLHAYVFDEAEVTRLVYQIVGDMVAAAAEQAAAEAAEAERIANDPRPELRYWTDWETGLTIRTEGPLTPAQLQRASRDELAGYRLVDMGETSTDEHPNGLLDD